jgi:hypothetical protein
LKHGENAASRVAGFDPVSERVREKILLCAFFVRLYKASSKINWKLDNVEEG